MKQTFLFFSYFFLLSLSGCRISGRFYLYNQRLFSLCDIVILNVVVINLLEMCQCFVLFFRFNTTFPVFCSILLLLLKEACYTSHFVVVYLRIKLMQTSYYLCVEDSCVIIIFYFISIKIKLRMCFMITEMTHYVYRKVLAGNL